MNARSVSAWVVAGACLLGATGLAAGASPKGAKAIFDSGEGTTIAMASSAPRPAVVVREVERRQPYVGISYQIMQVSDDGRMYPVSRSRVFRNGERVKIFARTNRPGYLTVMNIGPSGNTNVLFNDYVEPFRPIDVPRATNLVFVGEPGNERLLFMLSNNPNPIIPGNGPAPGTTVAMPSPPPGAAGGYAGNPVPAGYTPPPAGYAPPGPGYAPPVGGAVQPPGYAPAPGYAPPAPGYAPPAPGYAPPMDASAPAPLPGDAYPPMASPAAPIVASLDGAKNMRGAKDLVAEDGMRSTYAVLAPGDAYRPRRAGTKDLVLESQGGINYGVVPVSALSDGGILTLQVNLRHQ
jgi:hypothetical protein